MNPRIQIIDDNTALTTLLAKALAKFGYDPVVENNPLLAINTVRHYMPDVILLDVMMPERDGGRVLADLRNDLSLRYIPVILLTAIAREAQALANVGGIRSTILSKPVELQELLETINSHIVASKSYNELQQPKSSGHHLLSGISELADFDQEMPWSDSPGIQARLAGNPSIAFSPEFPPRAVSAGLPAGTGLGFSFPSRSDTDKPSNGPWQP